MGAKTLLYKSLLNRVEDVSPATKIAFLKGYLKRAKAEVGRGQEKKEKTSCKVCGYPSYSEECNFCRLVKRFGNEAAVRFDIYVPSEP